MITTYIKFFLTAGFALVLASARLVSQEVPPIINYSPSTYGGDNQNWGTSQGDDGTIYIANNKGLLSFNGAQWDLYKSPNETILRSVMAHNELVYTGAHMDFGKWSKDLTGKLIYTSLTNRLNVKLLEGEQFWNITSYENKIIFQSLRRFFIFDPKTEIVNIIESPDDFKLFDVDGFLVFQIMGKGLFTLKDGEPQLYNDNTIFKTIKFVNFFKRSNTWLGVSVDKGIFAISENLIEPWGNSTTLLEEGMSIFSAISLEDGGIALGTISSGFLKISNSGDVVYNIMQGRGLINNTVLSLFEDTDQNVWIGLDNGIACVNTKSPIETYVDYNGKLGAIYASIEYNDNLYVGTNQGLFFRENSKEKFKLISGTAGQVWTLKLIDNSLFCGHNEGTFIIDKDKATLISDIKGTWDIKKIKGKENLLIQGNYEGLFILKKDKEKWSLRNKINGFRTSSKYFDFVSDNKLLVSNEYEGVYEIQLDSSLTQSISVNFNTSVEKGEHSSLVDFNETTYYATEKGFFKYDIKKSSFVKNDEISKLLNDNYASGKLINDNNGSLWIFLTDRLLRITNNQLGENLSINEVFISKDQGSFSKGYENLYKMGANKYLLGTTNGFLTFKITEPDYKTNVTIHKIGQKTLEGDQVWLPINKDTIFSVKNNTLHFYYNTLVFEKYNKPEYQYRLLGFYDQWSGWSNNTDIEFSNIPSGKYTFEVRSKVAGVLSPNKATYSFTIEKAWYVSNIAIVVYILFAILVISLVQWITIRFYKKQRKNLLERKEREMELRSLEIEKENIELRNSNLKNEITARNRELATLTLGIVDKNNTLNSIKEELKSLTPNKEEIKKVINHINKNLNTEQNWNVFEQAFNRADKDFFKKVKDIHPKLTSNDLKLCVYLRLNMSSKEIAPLLNISYRSVEIKRYRLRKKISLDHSVNLNDYFINL